MLCYYLGYLMELGKEIGVQLVEDFRAGTASVDIMLLMSPLASFRASNSYVKTMEIGLEIRKL